MLIIDKLNSIRNNLRDPAIVRMRGAVQWALRQGVAAFLAANVCLQPRTAGQFVVPLFAGGPALEPAPCILAS